MVRCVLPCRWPNSAFKELLYRLGRGQGGGEAYVTLGQKSMDKEALHRREPSGGSEKQV